MRRVINGYKIFDHKRSNMIPMVKGNKRLNILPNMSIVEAQL